MNDFWLALVVLFMLFAVWYCRWSSRVLSEAMDEDIRKAELMRELAE